MKDFLQGLVFSLSILFAIWNGVGFMLGLIPDNNMKNNCEYDRIIKYTPGYVFACEITKKRW